MKTAAIFLALFAVLNAADAYAPQTNSAPKAFAQFKKTVGSTLVAATIAANVLNPAADAAVFDSSNFNFGSSTIVAEKVVREGIYGDFEVDVVPQTRDNAESTFKTAKQTKSKKGKYTAILAILVVGSFIIPMAQYFWYVKDDDSSEQFFGQKKAPEPEPEPPKKKGWFN
eukprot:scaffold4133_cov239-Chaetoceros_neogracile.AAC.3